MQPVLVDGSELVTQSLVQKLDDFGLALHDELQELRPGLGLCEFRMLLAKNKQAGVPGTKPSGTCPANPGKLGRCGRDFWLIPRVIHDPAMRAAGLTG